RNKKIWFYIPARFSPFQYSGPYGRLFATCLCVFRAVGYSAKRKYYVGRCFQYGCDEDDCFRGSIHAGQSDRNKTGISTRRVMVIKEASFLVSNTDYQKCPDPGLPEYAFIGRSNVGKSSLINRLAARSNLAKTSSTPGKTQLINHFIINKSWYLVDLPGYGYAKIGKHEREKWERMIYDYLRNRPNLVCTFVLVDSRHEMQKADLEFMMNLTELGVPFNLVFTKVDKLRPNQVNPTIERYLQQMKEYWEELPRYFVTSSEKSIGREDLLLAIEEYNQIF